MEVKNLFEVLDQLAEADFHQFNNFNDSGFGICKITGVSPVWEMHPDTDEFFYVLEGQVEISLYEDQGIVPYTATVGDTFVVPKGIWHKPGAITGAKFFYFTPGQSLHSDAEDPR